MQGVVVKEMAPDIITLRWLPWQVVTSWHHARDISTWCKSGANSFEPTERGDGRLQVWKLSEGLPWLCLNSSRGVDPDQVGQLRIEFPSLERKHLTLIVSVEMVMVRVLDSIGELPDSISSRAEQTQWKKRNFLPFYVPSSAFSLGSTWGHGWANPL